MTRQTELVAQRYQIVKAIPGTDQRESDIVTPKLIDHDVGHAHHDVHAILRTHDTDVGDQVPAAAAQFRVGLAGLQPHAGPARYGRP